MSHSDVKSLVSDIVAREEQSSGVIEPLNRSLGFIVNALARVMRNELDAVVKPYGLTPTTWTVLMALCEEDRLSQTDLANRVFLDGATTTRALDLLEARGFIQRVRDEEDRRVQIIHLTSEGLDLGRKLSLLGKEINQRVLTPLEDEEKGLLLSFLIQILDHLQTAVQTENIEGYAADQR
ncbi:MAG: MarR family winged helix-turn-helix transcriptional regulator [bacterium]